MMYGFSFLFIINLISSHINESHTANYWNIYNFQYTTEKKIKKDRDDFYVDLKDLNFK